ncbi:MAG: hypothetical protein MUC34_05645 [Anaerolineae bacterium]|nr:hypothetical protein [Anaerolineae bacterium]
MYDSYGALQASSIASAARHYADYEAAVIGKGVSRFHSLRMRAVVRRLLAKVSGQSRRLLDLAVVRQEKTVQGIYEKGCVTVEISNILGSECRVCDFDSEFLPLSESGAQRWAGIYAARLCGTSLPAISLVQVGNMYFVRDGHHRVSVARVLGEQYIEANVQVWEVEGETASAPAMAMQLVSAM